MMDVLVIGLGSMGKRRIRLLKRFAEVNSIIGVDGRLDRRKEASELYGCAVYESIDLAIAKHPNIECCFVCTSPLSHNTLIKEALKRRLHVFTEINLVSDGYNENMELAKEKNQTLFLSSTFYYREEIKYIRHYLRDCNKLNYVYHIGQYLPDWHPWESFNDFFVGDKRTNGCREIMAIELPWLIGTFGDVLDVSVLSDNMTNLGLPYKDNYIVQLQHENGNKGVLIVDVVSPKAVRNLEIYGENVYISWNGAPDTLQAYDKDNKSIIKPIMLEESEHIEGYGSFIIENAYQNEIKEFFDVVYNGKQPIYGFEKDKMVLDVIDRIEGIHE